MNRVGVVNEREEMRADSAGEAGSKRNRKDELETAPKTYGDSGRMVFVDV